MKVTLIILQRQQKRLGRRGLNSELKIERPMFEIFASSMKSMQFLLSTSSILDLVPAKKVLQYFAFLDPNYSAPYYFLRLCFRLPKGISTNFNHREFQH